MTKHQTTDFAAQETATLESIGAVLGVEIEPIGMHDDLVDGHAKLQRNLDRILTALTQKKKKRFRWLESFDDV